MKCVEFQQQLAAWLAAPSDDELSPSLAAHLQDCPECQTLLEGDSAADTQPRAALHEPAAAERVARGAMEQVKVLVAARMNSSPAFTALFATRGTYWNVPLAASVSLAAGFLLAWMLLPPKIVNIAPQQPTITKTDTGKSNDPAVPMPPPVQTVAHLVAATGAVEHFDEARQNWVSVDPKLFACPSDGRLRTKSNVQCELTTPEGCVIRLNDQTEVTLRGSSVIDLHQGQVWCRSPGETQFEVRVANSLISESPAGLTNKPTLVCVGASCVMTGIQDSGNVQVVNAAGDIKVRTAAGQQDLDPGQVAEISNGQVIANPQRVDPLLATRWMQPLLIKQGPDSAELRERVDTLLAEVGRSKIATLYEQEIRALGEHGVLPLVRFIQSPLSVDQKSRRHTAMRLVADLAPNWLVPDLIDLLGDDEPYIRFSAATALYRLTAIDMNLPADRWREARNDEQEQARTEWRGWWAKHHAEYPTHQLRVIKE